MASRIYAVKASTEKPGFCPQEVLRSTLRSSSVRDLGVAAAAPSAKDKQVQAFLAAGHVCTVMGYEEYEPIAEAHHVPIVVTGFEPVDILQGIYLATRALEAGTYGVQNQYTRSVRRGGNAEARKLCQTVFEVTDRAWRGIGVIPNSGLRLRRELQRFDALARLGSRLGPVPPTRATEATDASGPAPCLAGQVLCGTLKPTECPSFGTACTPEQPLGAPMVSAEGACAAYYRYGRALTPQG